MNDWTPHGFGRLVFDNQSPILLSKRILEGYFQDGQLHGFGRYYWGDGTKYEGNFKDGKGNGHGKCHNENGYCYVGEWKNGMRDGHGTYCSDKLVIPGMLEKGKFIGF